MAVKKPLVMGDLWIEQLQPGDTIDVGEQSINLVADSTVAPGAPVYSSAAGHFDKAKADASGTVLCIGLAAAAITSAASGAIKFDGILSLTTGQWDTITGQTGGLTFNTTYWLDPTTAGKMTPTKPTTTGLYVMPLGRALSTTEFELLLGSPILL